MPKFLKYSILYTIGAGGYGLLELLFRGFTHWSMLLAGGTCFCFLYRINDAPGLKLWKKCLLGSVVITTVEFIAGVIVNLWLDWNVWSYSRYVFNLYGQICLLFSCLWFLISIPAMALCGKLRNFFEKAPLFQRERQGGWFRVGRRRA